MAARGAIGTGGLSGCEWLRPDDVGGEARGAGLVEALGKEGPPLGAM